MNDPGSPPWLTALERPEAYPHPVQAIQRVETHISWVFLAGEHAYKIKKPVDLGFLDYSTLEKRHSCCREELRLNRRLAAPLYLGLSRITGPAERARMDGEGEVLEYAVHMRQFPVEDQFDRLLADGRLEARHLETLAEDIARFHRTLADPAPPDSDFGTPERVIRPMRENFQHLEGADPRLPALHRWTETTFQRLRPRLEERRRQGWIRECHGDLHLGNIVLWEGRPLPFDGIEFDPYLRWIDVQSEQAFLTMDLEDRGRRDLAFLALNTYLAHSGDYAGLAVLPFYQVYRAMVRAKVNHIRLTQGGLDDSERACLERDFHQYLALAEGYTRPPRPVLILTSGVSGSGKSWLARRLAMAGGAIHLRSDVERKRLFGLPPLARTHAAPDAAIYTPEATVATYRRLLELAETVLAAGYPVLVDATFLTRDLRAPFLALAERLGMPCRVLHTTAPRPVLEERVRRRAEQGRDPSEADVAILERQLQKVEPWAADEKERVVTVDTRDPVDVAALAGGLHLHPEGGG